MARLTKEQIAALRAAGLDAGFIKRIWGEEAIPMGKDGKIDPEIVSELAAAKGIGFPKDGRIDVHVAQKMKDAGVMPEGSYTDIEIDGKKGRTTGKRKKRWHLGWNL